MTNPEIIKGIKSGKPNSRQRKAISGVGERGWEVRTMTMETTKNESPNTKRESASFDVSQLERALINKIVGRAMRLCKSEGVDYSQRDCEMDITACHANGNPLDLHRLLEAPVDTFGHDVFGIRRFINRRDGTLTKMFSPRCSALNGGGK